jgi:hypothetical protein
MNVPTVEASVAIQLFEPFLIVRAISYKTFLASWTWLTIRLWVKSQVQWSNGSTAESLYYFVVRQNLASAPVPRQLKIKGHNASLSLYSLQATR